jgi:hypothetical protein
MEEKPQRTTAAPSGGHRKAPVFNRRDVARNTHPRGNQEVDRRDYDRSVEAFSRVLGS